MRRQESNLRPPQDHCGALPAEVAESCATGGFILVAGLRSACNRCLVFRVLTVIGDNRKSSRILATKTAYRPRADLAETDREIFHLIPIRPIAIPEIGAFFDRKRNHSCRARIGANHPNVGIAIARRDLAISAASAEILFAKQRAVLDVHFAHDKFVSKPDVPEG